MWHGITAKLAQSQTKNIAARVDVSIPRGTTFWGKVLFMWGFRLPYISIALAAQFCCAEYLPLRNGHEFMAQQVVWAVVF